MSEKREEYIKGYEQGVKDLAEKVKKYYGALKGGTYSSLVSFHVEQQSEALIVGVKGEKCEKV